MTMTPSSSARRPRRPRRRRSGCPRAVASPSSTARRRPRALHAALVLGLGLVRSPGAPSWGPSSADAAAPAPEPGEDLRRRSRRSSRRRTNTAAPAARTCSRSPMSTSASARAKSMAAPRSVVRPAARSAREPTELPTNRRRRRQARPAAGHRRTRITGGSGPRSRRPGSAAGDDLVEDAAAGLTADMADILLVLEDDAEGLVHELGLSSRGPEREQRGCPVERLGYAGTLVSSASRSRWTNPTIWPASRSGASGTRVSTISSSRW